MYVCIYVCMYVCMYVRMYVCMYVYMYVCIQDGCMFFFVLGIVQGTSDGAEGKCCQSE